MTIYAKERFARNLLVGSCVLLLVGVCVVLSKQSAPTPGPYDIHVTDVSAAAPSSTPSTSPSASGTVIHLAMPQQTGEDFVRESNGFHSMCLHQVLDKDPEGRELLELFKDRVGYALIIGPKKLARVQPSYLPTAVWIVVSTKVERIPNGFPIYGNWEYQNAMHALFAPLDTEFSQPWAGARLAHELLHAQHYLSGVMPARPSDEQLLLEEVRGNRLELRLLDRTTGGKYLNQIDAWLATQAHLPDAPREWYRAPDETLFQSLQQLFPKSLSENETATRRGSLMSSLNLRLGERKGLNDAAIASSQHVDRIRPNK